MLELNHESDREVRITVVGDGGWGTALSLLLDENGRDVLLWSVDREYAHQMARTRRNPKFLPGVRLPRSIKISSELGEAMEFGDMLIFAVPTQYMRAVLRRCKRYFNGNPIVNVAKGLEARTMLRGSQIIAEVLRTERVVVLSGPSHAEEVARKLPTTVVVASRDDELARDVQSVMMSPYFRVYTSDDIIGVELGGALKNVIAIAAGICDGLGLGDNTKAALLTRGTVEIARLGRAMGARPETFWGLSGIGDLITTAVSPHGRNRRVGYLIGKGRSLRGILDSMSQVAEGVWTAKAVHKLSKLYGVEMPICEQVYRVLHRGKNPERAVAELMLREPKSEL